jgi:hypothetical protein
LGSIKLATNNEVTMRNLVAESVEATSWMDAALNGQKYGNVYGRLASSVIWSSATDDYGNLIVPIDPAELAAKINAAPFPLLVGHDPGRPVGKVLSAEVFTANDGETFVAALLGFYDSAGLQSFQDLGLDPQAGAPSPAKLPMLPDDFWIALAADPKDVEVEWLEALARSAPVRVDVLELSHNAAEALNEVIIVGVLFVTLVWNPFVTTVANEAGKDAYAAVRGWLRTLLERLAERRNPILEIQSHHQGCMISFVLRGRNVERHYRAYDALPAAAARANQLIAKMGRAGMPPVRLLYEFHRTDDVWFPSFAELSDGRLVSDDATLIAQEQLPASLSLGLGPKNLVRR